MNDGTRLANGTSGQEATTSFLARRSARRARDEVAVRNGGGHVDRSHRFTIVSGRVDRESVKGTFGLSLSWRNSARRDRSASSEGPLAVMRLHFDLHVPRLGRDVSCHRAFFFGSVPASNARLNGASTEPPRVEHEAEEHVIDLRAPHDDLLPVERAAGAGEATTPRMGLFAHNPVIESEPFAVVTREPRPTPPPFASMGDVAATIEAEHPVVTHGRSTISRSTITRRDDRAGANGRATYDAREPSNADEARGARDTRDTRDDGEYRDPNAPLPEVWHPDPAGHAELRYWDGHRWTAHISTGGRLWLSPMDAPAPGTGRTTD